MGISVVLPCFNEEQNIAAAIADVLRWLGSIDRDGEIIVVDDGSTDNSVAVVKDIAASAPSVRLVQHESNRGYGAAVATGCDNATKELIAFMDSDGQFHASDLSLLLKHMDTVRFVTGRRRRRADPFIRNMFGKVLGALIFVRYRLWLRDVNCGMKIFHKDVWERIRPPTDLEKFFNTALFMQLKHYKEPWSQVDVPHYPRLAGQPTGGSFGVIVGMMHEMHDLSMIKRLLKLQRTSMTSSKASDALEVKDEQSHIAHSRTSVEAQM